LGTFTAVNNECPTNNNKQQQQQQQQQQQKRAKSPAHFVIDDDVRVWVSLALTHLSKNLT
jgi:hypothetical protein